MNTLFAVVALPPNSTNDIAAVALHNMAAIVRANATYVGGQAAELQHRIDRLDTEVMLLGGAFLVLAMILWVMNRNHRKYRKLLKRVDEEILQINSRSDE